MKTRETADTYYINEIIIEQVRKVVPTGIVARRDSYGVLRNWKYIQHQKRISLELKMAPTRVYITFGRLQR
jgi:hypothetical protein